MKQFGLNQSQMAIKTNIKQPNLSAILNLKRPCDDAILNKIVISLDIDKDWLLTGEGEMLRNQTLNISPMNTVKDRLKAYIKSQGLKTRSFEISIGASNGYVNGLVNTIGPKYLNKILEIYPNLNREWLLFGEGNMLLSDVEKMRDLEEETAVINFSDGVPYYDEDFVLGFSEIGFPFAEKPSFLVRMPKYQNATLWCNATGDSMVPEINSGDVVALQLVEDHSFLVYGDVYAIMTTNGLRTIKRLGKSSEAGCYRLIPTNQSYEDQDIPKDKILRVFRVLGNLHTF